jgi:AcrR family transcriptional regulator
VSIAALYRRFPTREGLVAAAFEAELTEYAVAAEEALAVEDPWASFAGFVERICGMHADDRGFTDLVTMSIPSSKRTTELQLRGFKAVALIIDRAQRAGVLRDDLVLEDLPLVLMANAGVVHMTRDIAPVRVAAGAGLHPRRVPGVECPRPDAGAADPRPDGPGAQYRPRIQGRRPAGHLALPSCPVLTPASPLPRSNGAPSVVGSGATGNRRTVTDYLDAFWEVSTEFLRTDAGQSSRETGHLRK